MAQGERGQVLVVVGVVHLSEERHERETLAEAIGQLAACACAGPHVVGVEDGQFVALGRVHLVVRAVHLRANHGVGAVLANL